MKKLFSEFMEFIQKGNVLALAIGIMMGAAFNSIINTLINDVIMPVIGLITSGISFEKLFIPLNGQTYATLEEAVAAEAPVITIGNFIAAIINFILVAIVLFLLMRAANNFTAKLKKAEEEAPAAPAEPSDEVKLLTEIRDALQNK